MTNVGGYAEIRYTRAQPTKTCPTRRDGAWLLTRETLAVPAPWLLTRGGGGSSSSSEPSPLLRPEALPRRRYLGWALVSVDSARR
ncbi:hypothetical protein Taro_026871 [Colocasia esculenta]|uniref:Uncharacterized protein n=1 Tax=Colocasia esculenta TaxID=4460 RepID=A0A843VKU3_COLES|nr:hypothetical protein [Colocasia esculenta]